MRRYVLVVGLALVLACASPTSPAPAPTSTAPAASVSPDGAAPAPGESVRAAEPGAGATPSPDATHGERLATTPGDTPGASPPAASTPTPISAESVSPVAETEALAAVPEGATAPPAPAGGPTAVVLPPSARVVPGRTPTAVVVASSPVLAPEAAVAAPPVDYARAVKVVQDSRKGATGPRLEERIETQVAQTRAAGAELEVLGWQAALKGSAEVYQVTFTVRLNRQGMRAEWEVNLATGEVRPVNQLAEALEG